MTTQEIESENCRLQLVRAKLEAQYGGFTARASALIAEINAVNIQIANNWSRRDAAQRTLRKASFVLKHALDVLDDAKYVEQRAANHLIATKDIDGVHVDKVALAGSQLDQASTATAAAQVKVDEAKESIKTLNL